MTAVAGALGSVIGYLGGEVAEPAVFERLLWPQRFYNHLDGVSLFVVSVLMPMGGPLHSAALKTLDTFRDNHLYWGYEQSHLLGTAFFADSKLKYRWRGSRGDSHPELDVRNGFWPQVLRHIRPKTPSTRNGADAERLPVPSTPRRSKQYVYHLRLSPSSGPSSRGGDSPVVDVREDRISGHVLGGVIASELSAVGLAMFVGIHEHLAWLAVYLTVPLLLKIGALVFSVRREPLRPLSSTRESKRDVVEINTSHRGFMVIEGPSSPEGEPESLLGQFFRHYGHPKRDARREMISMLIVYCFVLYFPAGLLALLWMDETPQYIWLGYQVYTILSMHIVRVLGLTGTGRTEAYVATSLRKGKHVLLTGTNGEGVLATVRWIPVSNVKEGMREVENIMTDHEAFKDATSTRSISGGETGDKRPAV